MTKKFISALLALMMVFTLAMPSFAVSEENKTLSSAQIKEAVSVAVSAFVGADEDATVIIDNDLIKDVLSGADTAKEVSVFLSGILFIEESEADAISTEIADNSKYTIKVIENGKQTVYCSVDLITYPEIYDARVFLLAIDKFKANCDAVAAENGFESNYEGMSYSHIAGELALHMILSRFAKDTSVVNPLADWISERADMADLNVDEDR